MSYAESDTSSPVPSEDTGTEDPQAVAKEKALVKRLLEAIDEDKAAHKKAFQQMRDDMKVARTGRHPDYPDDHYVANITGRHLAQKTASLYAKNPKAIARRRETLDFAMWDETPESLQMAMQAAAMAQKAMAAAPAAIDPMTGQPQPPQVPPEVMQAQALLQDVQQGMQRREQARRIGKTMEILFTYAMREQAPVDFKTAMKKLVRRTSTTGVGYVELQFQRVNVPDPQVANRLRDEQARLARIRVLLENAADGEVEADSAEAAELELSISNLHGQQITVREGVVFHFPGSTRVIPDKLCTDLIGWAGSRRLTVADYYTKAQIKEMFGIDLGASYKAYELDGKASEGQDRSADPVERMGNDDLCCVYRHFDLGSGMLYVLCDGYDRLLKPAAAPDVKVEGFFPVYALTFNEVEDEKQLFPPSDVQLMLPMQSEYNRSRQGKREHRNAARPRYVSAQGAFSEPVQRNLAAAPPFSVTQTELAPDVKVADVLQVIPVPGVDPNLYDVNEIFTDIQLVVGTQEAQLGGVSKATATESSIAANSTATATGSNIDDLDGFLTRVARAAGQIMLREMTPEYVTRVVGPGALWPEMDDQAIQDELFLEVEAGSTGKPNQAVEIANWERLLPSLLQMPSLNPVWLARETLRRLDDRMDLTEALVQGLPAIVAQNRMSQPMVDPANDPTQQGPEGGDQNASPQAPDGSNAPMGDNRPPSV